jgi:hypothetical protein
MIYNTYFSNEEWLASNCDAVKVITNRYNLAGIEVISVTDDAHGVIVSYSIVDTKV